jgi:hypothetical protein
MFGLSNPCVNRASSSFLIYESLGAVCAVESLRHPCQQFVDDFGVPRGCLDCRIHASHVPEVCLMIFESIGAVWPVESVRHP